MNWCSIERERCTVTLKCGRQVDVSRDDTSIQERVHTVSDVVLSDRRWVGERVISEVLRQDSLRLEHLLVTALTNTDRYKLLVRDGTL